MTKEKSEQGKKNRAKGARFERVVRKDLEKKGWIVDKWTNNIELSIEHVPHTHVEGKLHTAKLNRFNMRTCGFPDFICFKLRMHDEGGGFRELLHEVIGNKFENPELLK